MHSRATCPVLLLLAALTIVAPARAQVLSRPTPAPLVTAENESWYVRGEPVPFAGNLYYPAGVQVFFNPNEMVRSGFHMGVPLYTRTTLEPFSIVYVPLAGGLMQPYERLRSGDIAGTAGSVPPSLVTPYEVGSADVLPQAPGAPSWTPLMTPPERMTPSPVATTGSRVAAPALGPGGAASGGQTRAAQPAEPVRPTHTKIGGTPEGINAIFIEFENVRWFSAGKATEVDLSRVARLGDYHGFPVWRERDGATDMIYVATTRDGRLAVPYSRHKPPFPREGK